MQSLKLINEISDETFNRFLKEFSFPSKRFMVKVRKELKAKGVLITTKELKKSFISFEDLENSSDSLLVYLRENQGRFGGEIHRFFYEMQLHFFYLNALAQNVNKSKSFKKKYFRALYELLQSILINGGFTFRSNEYVIKVEKQLLELIQSNLTPERVLQPNEIATTFFFQNMLNKLADKGYISKEFKNGQTLTYWLNRAFHLDFYTESQPEYSQLKISWNNLNHLADWLLFLKKFCIEYEHKNNKQLYDWVIEHVSYNGKNFSRGSTNFESLIRAIKIRKKQEGLYFSIDQKRLFQIKYTPLAVNSLNS